jgi:hypothetical protein
MPGHGLFVPAKVEQQHPELHIPNSAFLHIFNFFDSYTWSLDEDHPQPQQLTPGILGYILEQYINQQQVGAYYTKEDVTGYIAKYTIIPYLFEIVARQHPAAFQADAPLWLQLRTNPDRYIYAALRDNAPLHGEAAAEHAQRRVYYQQLRDWLSTGHVQHIDEFITHNLDMQQFAQDSIASITEPEMLATFFQTLQSITILDPTCGSGAFLMAALTVLEPLYATCIKRIESQGWHDRFASLLHEMGPHPSRAYSIRKAVITRNLYGVDILPQAITICQLRLLLALIAQVKSADAIEPLSTLDQHIRVGNALVGASRHEEHEQEDVDETKFDEAGARERRPFHWCKEFATIIDHGGFSIIIGNPPYVEYHANTFPYTLRNFTTASSGNLYPCIIERTQQILAPNGREGMILPLAAFATRNMLPLLDGFLRWFPTSWVSFYHFRPSMLFSGDKKANIPTAICLTKRQGPAQRYSTHLSKWFTEERPQLFSLLRYCQVTTPRDHENRHYYPKFGQRLENTIMRKLLPHTCVRTYLTTQLVQENSLFYRSAGGLYWKVFTNFPWPYRTTSNKQCTFQAAYDRDLFVALFNSSLFWWYYTVTFDTFNLKDYMLFGFRFTYPYDAEIATALKNACQQLMNDFRRNAKHLTRGQTGSYTIYARKSKTIIDAIDDVLARHYGLTEQEATFIKNYDLKYRLRQEQAEA